MGSFAITTGSLFRAPSSRFSPSSPESSQYGEEEVKVVENEKQKPDIMVCV